MIVRLLTAWALVAAVLWLAAGLLDSVRIDGGLFALLGVALVFSAVHLVIGPLLRLVSAPVTLVTLGLFSLVVNGLLLAITAGLSDALAVGGFLGVILAALVISLLLTLLTFVVDRVRPHEDDDGARLRT